MSLRRVVTPLALGVLGLLSLTSCGSDFPLGSNGSVTPTVTPPSTVPPPPTVPPAPTSTPEPTYSRTLVTTAFPDETCKAAAVQGDTSVEAPYATDDEGRPLCPLSALHLETDEVDDLVDELGCPNQTKGSAPPSSALDCSYTALMGLEIHPSPRSFRNGEPIPVQYDFTPTGLPKTDVDGNLLDGEFYTSDCLRLAAAGQDALCDNIVQAAGPEQAAMAIYRVVDPAELNPPETGSREWEKAGDAYFLDTETAIGFVDHFSQLVLVKLPPMVDLDPGDGLIGETTMRSAFSLRTDPAGGSELTFVARFVAEGNQLQPTVDGDLELIVVIADPFLSEGVRGECQDKPLDRTLNCLLGLDSLGGTGKVNAIPTFGVLDGFLGLSAEGSNWPAIGGSAIRVHWDPSSP